VVHRLEGARRCIHRKRENRNFIQSSWVF